MADTKMFQVNEGFDLNAMVGKLIQVYQGKGFQVTAMSMGNGVSIKFSKDGSGIKKYIGLAAEITANITMNGGNTLMVNFTDSEWTGKIVGFIIGWFLCWIPCVTAIIGAIKQVNMPKEISTDIQMLASGGPTPFAVG